jgi:uncharacterized protein (TIGR00156 family)
MWSINDFTTLRHSEEYNMRQVLLAAVLVGFSGTLLAQTEPPIANDHPAGQEGPEATGRLETAAATRVYTVKEVLGSRQDDQDVVLRGRIVRHVKGEDYIFADSTGEIEVEIDDDDYPRDRVPMNTDVEIRGEVDLDRNRPPTIEVDEIVRAPTRAR